MHEAYDMRWKYLPRLLRFLWQIDKRDMLIISGVLAIGGIMPLASVVSLRHFVDAVIGLLDGTVSFTTTSGWLFAFILASYLSWALGVLQQMVSSSIQERLKAKTQEQLYRKACRVPLPTFDNAAYFDQLHRAKEGLENRLFDTLQAFFPIPGYLITTISLIIYLGTTSILLPILLLAGMIPIYFINRRFNARRHELEMRLTESERKQAYLRDLMIQKAPAAEIRLFGLGTFIFDKYRALFFHMRDERLHFERQRMKEIIRGTSSEQMTYGMVLTGIIIMVLQGRLSVGYYAAYLSACEQFRDAFMMLMAGIYTMDEDLRYIGDMLDYLELNEEDTGGVVLTAQPHTVVPSSKEDGVPEIRFESVSFLYPGTDQPVLDNLTLTIAPRERIALAGENGAGKSTLIRLLLGLYRPTTGRIMIDGHDLADLDLGWWRKHIGVVFQDYMKYEVSVRENLGFGHIDYIEDDARLYEAAARSGAQKMIETLPGGMDTILGRVYDAEGQELSIGQWQKLAIARAYLCNGGILVLDEPTAALDPSAEVDVYRQFRDMSTGKSVILISHRLGSARLADRILFLDKGQITEDGPHTDLMKSGGRYAEMYAIQAEWYR